MRAPAGGTLEDRLRDGPLAPAQAVSVVARLADALAALHEKKCLHGAVKPSVRPSLRVIGVRLQDVAGRGSRDRQPHRAVQLHAVDLEEQLRTCSGVSVGASSSMSDRTPTGQVTALVEAGLAADEAFLSVEPQQVVPCQPERRHLRPCPGRGWGETR